MTNLEKLVDEYKTKIDELEKKNLEYNKSSITTNEKLFLINVKDWKVIIHLKPKQLNWKRKTLKYHQNLNKLNPQSNN